jgi:hypothetical protein
MSFALKAMADRNYEAKIRRRWFYFRNSSVFGISIQNEEAGAKDVQSTFNHGQQGEGIIILMHLSS